MSSYTGWLMPHIDLRMSEQNACLALGQIYQSPPLQGLLQLPWLQAHPWNAPPAPLAHLMHAAADSGASAISHSQQ